MSIPTAVETFSSFAYAVEPRAFEYGRARHVVREIRRMWKTPDHIHFYVQDEHDSFFELDYDQINDNWRLRTFGESCPAPASPKSTSRLPS